MPCPFHVSSPSFITKWLWLESLSSSLLSPFHLHLPHTVIFIFCLKLTILDFFFIFSRSDIGFSSSFRRIETFVLLADLHLVELAIYGPFGVAPAGSDLRLLQAASKNDNDPQSKLTSCTKKNGETNKKQLTWPYLWSVTLLQQVEVKLVDCWSWLRETFRPQPTNFFFLSKDHNHAYPARLQQHGNSRKIQ